MKNALRPFGRTRSLPVVALAGLALFPLVMPGHVAAQSADELQRQAANIANELDRLEEQMSALDEDHIVAVNRQEELAAEIAAIEGEVAQAEAELSEMRGTLYTAAVNQFMHGGRNSTLTNLLASSGGVQDALTRSEMISIALNQGSVTTDSLDASATELAKKKDKLEKQRSEAEAAASYVAERRSNADAAYDKYQRLLESVTGDLAEALKNERRRRGRNVDPPNPADIAQYKNFTGGSARARLAVEKALWFASVGVPYKVNRTLSDSVGRDTHLPVQQRKGVDCSGLTILAWRAAGVRLAGSSRAQYAQFPKVPKSQARPGDLVFYHSPISHVSLYIGNGREVHAPQRGDIVRVRSTDWDRVVGVVRPG